MSIANEIQRLQSAKADIKSAIEQKGVTVGDGTIDTYAEKINEISGGASGDYEQGYEEGKNSVVPFERYAERIQLISLNVFSKAEAVLNLDNATTLQCLCEVSTSENNNITVEHLTVNCPNAVTNVSYAFRNNNPHYDDTLKQLTFNVDTSKSTAFSYFVAYHRALETIDGSPLDFSSVTATQYNIFQNCNALKDIRFVANTIGINFGFPNCPNLTTDTIQSIIDGLADLTGGTTQTLTLHATVGGKLTDEQKATITAKNWTLVY